MDPETPTEPTTPASTTEPAAPSAPTTPTSPPPAALTADSVQAMIDAAVRKAYDAGAKAGRVSTESKQGKTPPKQAPTTEATPPAATGDDAEFGEALTDAIGEYSFDKDQRREIRAAARRERPEDVEGFVSRWARMFGKAPGQSTPQTPGATPAAGAQPPGTTPASAPPGAAKPVPPTPPPAAPPSIDRDGEPVLRALSEEDRQDAWQAYVRRKGANPADPYDPRNRPVWREHRKRFEAELATASVRIGARPVR